MKTDHLASIPPHAAAHQHANISEKPRAADQIAASRQETNQTILKMSAEVSISAGNNSLGVLLKSAIEHINEALAPELGENAIQNAADSGMDFSPQATADRIVSMSTAFYDNYAAQHPEKDAATALKDFTALIGGGIEKGFAEAREILSGLDVLQGDIAGNIDKTWEMVQAGLQAFTDSHSNKTPGDLTEVMA